MTDEKPDPYTWRELWTEARSSPLKMLRLLALALVLILCATVVVLALSFG